MGDSLVETEQKKKTNQDVLIIDADEASLEGLKKICEKMDRFRFIVTAKDGREASTKLSNQKFKLILMELNLPKKNGTELIRIIESSENSLKSVLVISQEIAQEQLKTLVSKGVKQIMVKPVDAESLTAKIQNMLG